MKNFFKILMAGFMLGFSSRSSFEVADQAERERSKDDDDRPDPDFDVGCSHEPSNMFYHPVIDDD